MLPGRVHQVAHGRKHHRRRFPSLDQVQKERQARRHQPDERPWMEEGDHAAPAGRAERPAEGDPERRIGRDTVISDPVPAAGTVPVRHHALDRAVVCLGPVPRAQHDRRPRFGILEPGLGRPAQRHLRRVHQVEHEDLVAAVAEELQRMEGGVPVEQQVGNEDHEAAPPQPVHHPAQRGLGRGAEPWLKGRKNPRAACTSGPAGPGPAPPRGPPHRR